MSRGGVVESIACETHITDASLDSTSLSPELFLERYWVRWAKFTADLVSLQLALFLALVLSELPWPWFHARVAPRLYWELSTALLLVPCGLWLAGLYPGYGLTLAERLKRRVRTTTFFFMTFTVWWFFVHHGTFSRLFALLVFLLALVLPLPIQRLLRSLLQRRDLWGTPVLVLGAGLTGQRAVASLLANPDLGFRPVALLDDDREKWGVNFSGVSVLGGLNRARAFKGKLHYVLLALPGMQRDLQVHLVNSLPFSHILIIPDLIGVQSLWVEARDLCGMVGLEIQKKLLLYRNTYLKLLMDYLLGVPLFLLSLPILTVCGLWIYFITGANPFFCQVREGRGGRKFRVWKLRTMYPNAEKLLQQHLASDPAAKKEWNTYFKLKDDPRILKGVGNFLRKSSIDELPQLWNVLRREMSLVGPRPFPHYHLEQFDGDFRRMRRRVLPGMTGLWQVSARSDGNLAVQEKLDTYYILNWSIWLDLSLLCQTFLTVLTGKGAY